MYAWLNLLDEKAKGNHVNAGDLKKHRNDVFRMFQIVPEGEEVSVFGNVADTVDRFLKRIADENIIFTDLGIESDMESEVRDLRSAYKRN